MVISPLEGIVYSLMNLERLREGENGVGGREDDASRQGERCDALNCHISVNVNLMRSSL